MSGASCANIRNVQDNCVLLGEKLIEQGRVDFGRDLIANGMRHDNSKFYGIEYEYMAPLYVTSAAEDTKKVKLRLAIEHHGKTNLHHPEAWDSIHAMTELYVAEMVCDWKARSEEFGSSLRDYIKNQAMKRFKFEEKDKVHVLIMGFVDMICEKPFVAA